jgi:hypothetical protein
LRIVKIRCGNELASFADEAGRLLGQRHCLPALE